MKDIFELILTFFAEYFAFMYRGVQARKPTDEEYEIVVEKKQVTEQKNVFPNTDQPPDRKIILLDPNQDPDQTPEPKTVSLNPRIVIFSIINLLLGVCLLNAIAKKSGTDLLQFGAVAIILWLSWSVVIYLSNNAWGHTPSISFFRSLGYSLQVFSIVYILASLATFLVAGFIGWEVGPKFGIFYLTEGVLLIIYLPNFIQTPYKFLNLAFATCFALAIPYLNYRLYSRLNLPFPAAPPEKRTSIVIFATQPPVDPKDLRQALNNIGNPSVKNIYFILNLSNPRSDSSSLMIDSFRPIKYSNLAALLTHVERSGRAYANIYLIADFGFDTGSFPCCMYCDTLFAYAKGLNSVWKMPHPNVHDPNVQFLITQKCRDFMFYKEAIISDLTR